jgi:hypothetical protein
MALCLPPVSAAGPGTTRTEVAHRFSIFFRSEAPSRIRSRPLGWSPRQGARSRACVQPSRRSACSPAPPGTINVENFPIFFRSPGSGAGVAFARGGWVCGARALVVFWQRARVARTRTPARGGHRGGGLSSTLPDVLLCPSRLRSRCPHSDARSRSGCLPFA